MKIWRLKVDFSDYESFKLENENRDFLRDFKKQILSSEPLDSKLDGLKIELVEGDIKSDYPKFWSSSGTPLFSERGAKALSYLVKSDSEFIKLAYDSGSYYLVNVTRVLDAINYEKSKVRKLETGLVVGLESYSFKSKIIKGHNIFKILLNGRVMSTEVFVSDEFKRVVEDKHLLGFKFVEVWSDDD